jgi:hypothetical protein
MSQPVRLLLISTIGNRDLTLDGSLLPREEFRDRTAELLEQCRRERAAVLGRLQAPILEPVVRWVLRQHTEPPGPSRPEPRRPQLCVYLVATDQPETTPQRVSDTLHAAALLREWLADRFKAHGLQSTKFWTYQSNPADYDEAYRYFQELERQRSFPDSGDFDIVYLNPTGGTPALTFGLLTVVLPFYGARAVVLYLPNGRDLPIRLNVGQQFRRAQLLDDVATQLDQWEFGRAAELLQRAGVPGHLAALTRALAYRLNFDFTLALRTIEHEVIPPSSGALRSAAIAQQEQLARLRDHAEALHNAVVPRPDCYPPLLRELYVNTLLTWEAGRYADFLARAFRFEEAALRWAVEETLHLPTGSAKQPRGSALPAFVEGIEGDPELLQHAQSPYEGRKLDYRRAPTRDLLRHLLDTPRLRSDPTAQQVKTLTDRLRRLSELRNMSIVAHGFKGVSREAIEHAYEEDCLADLRALARAVGVDPDVNPLAEARAALLDALRREQAHS